MFLSSSSLVLCFALVECFASVDSFVRIGLRSPSLLIGGMDGIEFDVPMGTIQRHRNQEHRNDGMIKMKRKKMMKGGSMDRSFIASRVRCDGFQETTRKGKMEKQIPSFLQGRMVRCLCRSFLRFRIPFHSMEENVSEPRRRECLPSGDSMLLPFDDPFHLPQCQAQLLPIFCSTCFRCGRTLDTIQCSDCS